MQVFTAIALLGAPLQAAVAQAHVAESGVHTLRASVVPSNQLSSEAARTHGIAVADDRGVLTVVVLERKQGDERSVPAEISATRIDLVGCAETVEMREVRANGGVSYMGSFRVVDSPIARYRIEALPAGVAEPLSVEFEERFHVPRWEAQPVTRDGCPCRCGAIRQMTPSMRIDSATRTKPAILAPST